MQTDAAVRQSTLVPVLGLLVVSAWLVAACTQSTDAKGETRGTSGRADERPPLVRVEAVAKRRVQRKIETTAYIEAEHAVVVLARVTGRVVEVTTDEGQKVTKGQILARLDDREIRANLAQISVQIADKKVRHELAKLEQEATLHREEQAGFELQKAQRDLERLAKLDSDLVSQKDLDDAQYGKDKAEAALKVAQFNTRKAKLDVSTAEQAIREVEARKMEVEVQLAEHEIRAPMTGVVTRRVIQGGEAISMASELFEVVDTANLIAYLDRPQRELALVQQAKVVIFTTDAYPGREFGADVDVISPVVDRGTGSFKIRVRIRRDDASVLRPGLFMRARILTEEDREAIMIPKTAILADGDDSIIFYIRDPLDGRGKARRLRLETGIEDDTSVECLNRGAKGLRPGDLIIVSGQQDLRDQTDVEVSQD